MSIETTWVCFMDEKYFVPFGCAWPRKFILMKCSYEKCVLSNQKAMSSAILEQHLRSEAQFWQEFLFWTSNQKNEKKLWKTVLNQMFSWRQDEKKPHTVKFPAIVTDKLKTQFSWRRLVLPDKNWELKQHQSTNYQRNFATQFQMIFSLKVVLCNSRTSICCLVENII